MKNTSNKGRYALLTCSLLAGAVPAMAGQTQKPNIIVILADDLGFSDLGCYGSEIDTPNIDALASQGIRLTQVYNSARSCPSRASLLTGLYPHQTGLGHMDGGKGPKWPVGYRGFRSDSDNVTIAEVMRDAGYYTAMAGKLHLGLRTNPVERGFEDYYGLLGGFNSFWNPDVYTRLPEGAPMIEYADGEFYATDAITDYAISFAGKAAEQKRPMFMYLAYNAPHFPLHAPREVTDKYMDTYLQGWDEIRARRAGRIDEMGLVEGNPELSPRGEVPGSMFLDNIHPIPAWNDLSVHEQRDLARRMAIFAAMVDIMDANIGRLVETLRENGQLDNTFILFTADNGACAEWHEFGFDYHSGTEYHTHAGEELAGMGLPGTYHHYGTGWANVGCTPFTLYKHFAHEGGISSPSWVWWGDNIEAKGSIDHTPLDIIDIMPTCVELAGTTYPAEYEGRAILPAEGESMLPVIRGGTPGERLLFAEHEGNRMVRRGDWKLVSALYRDNRWELYDISVDRTEQHDLAAAHPELVADLAAEYDRWAGRTNVLPYARMWNEFSNPNQKKFRITD